jgi:hypothetical protein
MQEMLATFTSESLVFLSQTIEIVRNRNFIHLLRLWNLVCHPKGIIYIEDIWEHGAEGNIWT